MSLILVDGYSEENKNNEEYLYAGYKTKVAQSFTGKTGKLTHCKFYLYKYGNPTGNVNAKLYSHSGTYGISSIPDTLFATSDNVDISTLPTWPLELITFNFMGIEQYELVADAHYCTLLEYPGDKGIAFGFQDMGPTHSGNMSWYSTSWKTYSNRDLIFYVYAEYTPPEEPPEPEKPKHLVCYPKVEKRIKSLSIQERLTGLDIQKRKINLEIEKR